jgi:hypothetical protein
MPAKAAIPARRRSTMRRENPAALRGRTERERLTMDGYLREQYG